MKTPGTFITESMADLAGALAESYEAPTAKDFHPLSRDTEVLLSSATEDERVGNAHVTSDDGGKTFYLRTDKYDQDFKSVSDLLAWLKKGHWQVEGHGRREESRAVNARSRSEAFDPMANIRKVDKDISNIEQTIAEIEQDIENIHKMENPDERALEAFERELLTLRRKLKKLVDG